MLRKLLTNSLIVIGLCVAATASAQISGADDAAGTSGAAATDTGGTTDASGPGESAAVPAVPTTTAAAPALDEGAYRVQVQGLEQKVNDLKERIFRSKARLNLLKETVLHGTISGSRAIVKHKNEMGSSFRLVKVVYAIDGSKIRSEVDNSGGLHDKKEFEIFNGSIVPGNHTISATMVFKGHGFGIFSYLKGYKFTVRSSHTFTASEGRQINVTVRAFEKGNFTTELKDRPAIDFKVNVMTIGKGGSQ